jgi:hypothetical protein
MILQLPRPGENSEAKRARAAGDGGSALFLVRHSAHQRKGNDGFAAGAAGTFQLFQ